MADEHGTSSGLLSWLLGGLVVGAIMLGLLVAAYEIGYNRGEDHGRAAVRAPTTEATPPPPSPTPTTTPNPPTPLPAKGRQLYTADSCAGCHSLDGSTSVGPSFKGLAGSSVTLTTGQTVTADDRYLEESITKPDAQIPKGYNAGVMGPAVASFHLADKPGDVAALVAFIKSQK